MTVTCPSCRASYRLNLERVPSGGGFFACRSCGHRVHIAPPEEEDDVGGSAALAPESPPQREPNPPDKEAIALAGAQNTESGQDGEPADQTRRGTNDLVTDVMKLPADLQGEEAVSPPPPPEPLAAPLPVPEPPLPVPAANIDATQPEFPAFANQVAPETPLAPPAPPAFDGAGDADEDLPPLADLPEPPAVHPAAEPQEEGAAGSAPDLHASPVFEDLNDLPTPALEAETPSAPDLADFDDLPAPQEETAGAGPGLDAASAAAGAASLEAPSLIDDLPLDGPEVEAAPFGETTSDEGPPQLDVDATAPDLPPTARAEPHDRVGGLDRRRMGLIAGIAGASAVVVAGIVATLVALNSPESPSKEIADQAQANKTPQVAQQGKPHTQPKQEEPGRSPAGEGPELTEKNVNELSYRELRFGATRLSATLAAEGRTTNKSVGLLLWATYRLAHVFGDTQAREHLLASAPAPQDASDLGPYGLSAALGALILSGKAKAARRVGTRLKGSAWRNSGTLSYVLATTFPCRGEDSKALRLLDEALGTDGSLADAELARAECLLQRRDPSDGIVALVKMAQSHADPDLRLRAAMALEEARQPVELLDQVLVEPLVLADADNVAPVRRDMFLRLLVRSRLREGDLEGALAAAQKRLERQPDNADAIVELSRLRLATGQDGLRSLVEARRRIEAPGLKARLVAEEVRVLTTLGKLEAAQGALAEAKALRSREATAFLKYAEGLLAQQQGNPRRAKAAYQAATRGRPDFPEARLAALLIAPPAKPNALLGRLTQIERKSTSALVAYHLAMAMAEHHNYGGAARLIDSVLWLDPTIVDPTDLVLRWIELLHRSGVAQRAAQITAALERSRPEDEKVRLALIAHAKRTGDTEAVVGHYRKLADLHPDNTAYRLALADALTSAGRSGEALSMLKKILQRKPEARSPQLLEALARASLDRDAVKARGYLTEAQTLGPRAEPWVLQGVLEERLGRDDAAREAFKKAIGLDATRSDARMALARLLLRTGAAEAAVEQLNEVLAYHSNHAEAAEMLGDAALELGENERAVAAYEKASEAGPSNTGVMMKLARVLLQRLGRVGPAAKTLRKVVAVEPRNADAHYYLGLALKDLGRPREALKELEGYLELQADGGFAADARRVIVDLQTD